MIRSRSRIARRTFLGGALAGVAVLAGHQWLRAQERAMQAQGAETPDAGWRMPAEWEPHEVCWLVWPRRGVIDGSALAAARTAHERLVRAIAAFEPVWLVAPPDEHAGLALLFAGSAHPIRLVALPADDVWVRDTGPSFVVGDSGRRAAALWRFNAWGGKNDSHAADAGLGRRMAERLGDPLVETGLVAEGGAIEIDGRGTLLTTETSILNPNRNPGLTRRDAESVFRRVLGATGVVWLPGSTVDQVTDGHVDGIAKFVRPGVVLSEVTKDPLHPEHEVLRENRRALELAQDAGGAAFEIVSIERPEKVRSRTPTFCDSYVNAYIANGGVIMPAFGDRDADLAAAALFARCWPDRRIVSLDVDAICEGGGGIHCVTQQVPPAGAPRA